VITLLDSGPLGLITHPKGGVEAQDCQAWVRALPAAGHIALLPEIIDYEHRRELLLANLSEAVKRLDTLKASGAYLPVTEDAYLQAAGFWAAARRQGLPTADRFALDADVILAAQAATLDPVQWQQPGARVVIATTNVGPMSRFADARLWCDIS